jgi:hypothetical protein
MHIVIDISEEDYKYLKKRYELDNLFLNYYGKLIVHGTLLPKNHGRLIYARDVGEYLTLADVPTIIEADKTESEE